MARKNVGLTYVKDFEFPKEQGFTGSAGKDPVKGYMRGGHVKSPDKTKGKGSTRRGIPKTVKGKGGKVGYQEGGPVPGHPEGKNPFDPTKSPAQYRLWEHKNHITAPPAAAEAPPADEGGGILGGLGRLFGRSGAELEKIGEAKGGRVKKYGEGGYYGKPGDKYPKRKSGPKGARSKMPKNVKAEGGSVHDRLKVAGAKMGYAYGGKVHVSDTSGEFKAKRGKQKTMDTGVQPARRGKNARNKAEAEAGGTGRLKPGLGRGGRARRS